MYLIWVLSFTPSLKTKTTTQGAKCKLDNFEVFHTIKYYCFLRFVQNGSLVPLEWTWNFNIFSESTIMQDEPISDFYEIFIDVLCVCNLHVISSIIRVSKHEKTLSMDTWSFFGAFLIWFNKSTKKLHFLLEILQIHAGFRQ